MPSARPRLITPDRALARRVVAALERWNVPVDDSGGDALADIAAGMFARLAAEAALKGCEPVTLLALLRHPLCRLGGDESAHLPAIALLERAILRGPRPRAGTDGLEHALQSLRAQRDTLHRSDPRGSLTDRDLDRAADLIAKLKPRSRRSPRQRKPRCATLQSVTIRWSPRSRSITRASLLPSPNATAKRCVRSSRPSPIADRLPTLRWSHMTMPNCSALSRPSGWCAGPAHPAHAFASMVRSKRGCSMPIASCLRVWSRASGRRSRATTRGSTGRCASSSASICRNGASACRRMTSRRPSVRRR